MKLKFELADNVAMTDYGLRKKCTICELYKPLKDFPESKMHAFKRSEVCKKCCEALRA